MDTHPSHSYQYLPPISHDHVQQSRQDYPYRLPTFIKAHVLVVLATQFPCPRKQVLGRLRNEEKKREIQK